MLTEKQREFRRLFMPIAVLEQHGIQEPKIDAYEICEQLGRVWEELELLAKQKKLNLTVQCITDVSERVAKIFDCTTGSFRNEEKWQSLIENDVNIEDDPYNSFSWIFSSLYWDHLSKHRFATAWIFINALRVQNGLSEYRLSVSTLGPFLASLASAGPPIYDGQTFNPEDYAA